jgi:cell division transport system permease protein
MFQFLTKLDYLLRETLLGLRRGGWMNWAAVSTVTVLLFLFGMSLQASWKLEGLLNQFGSQVEVSVYLDPGAQIESVKLVVRETARSNRSQNDYQRASLGIIGEATGNI